MRTLPDGLSELINSGENALVLCPALRAAESTACVDLLTLGEATQKNALSITYTQSPCDRLALCQQYTDTTPAETTILNIGTGSHSTASPDTEETAKHPAKLNIDHISSPADLTDLGVKITNQLDDWTAKMPDHQTVVCLHSLTALLQYITAEEAFKFVNIVTNRFSAADAIAHVHMDLHAHDEQTIRRFIPLFEVVCEYENSEWKLRAA